MTFWLRRWIEQSRTPTRPRGAVAVGDQLHLDVAGAGHQALEEDGAVAEGAQRLVAGALVGVLEVGRRGDHPDAAAAAAGGRLEHQRVADLRGGGQRVLEGVDRAAAPGRHRHADLLGDQLGADLVAEPAHRVGARADEGHARACRTGRRTRGPRRRSPSRATRRRRRCPPGPARARPGRRRDAPRPVRGRRPGRPRARTWRWPHRWCAAPRSGRGPSPAALSSRTAWISRMAASPRLTIAMRRNDTGNTPSWTRKCEDGLAL